MTDIREGSGLLGCAKVRGWLAAFLDGELAAPEAAAVRAHLDGCVDCRQQWEELEAIGDLAAQWRVDDTADLWPVLQVQIEPAPWEALRAELRQLRAETQALREEVAQLRRELAARPVPPPPARLLFPNSPPAPTGRRLV